MTTVLVVGVVSGILFGVMDAIINANPVAQRLLRAYEPIARTSVNPIAGVVIDLAYGLIMAAVFVILYESLPGSTGLLKGVSFAALAWFFRVVMSVGSQWMMFRVPGRALLYTLVTGLGEMLVLGAIYGLTLQPAM